MGRRKRSIGSGDDEPKVGPGATSSRSSGDEKAANKVGPGSGYGGMTKTTESAYNWVKDMFPSLKFMGGYNNRDVRGVPGKKSDHAYGRAFDIGGSPKQMAAAAEKLRTNPPPGLKYVIYNHKIASPGGPWRPYKGVNPHTDHIHASFST